MLFIKACGLYGYITGKKKRPTPNNSPFAKWELRDFLVMS